LLNPVTAETVAAALRDHAGLVVAPATIKLERRSWRWFAALPGDLILFIADTAESAARLAREGRVLTQLSGRVSFGLPRLYPIDAALGLQLRSRVPGAQLGGGGRERDFAAQPQGARLAEDLGRALAEIHTAFTAAEVEALGCDSAAPLLPPAEVLGEKIRDRLTDPEIAATFDALLRIYRATVPAPADIVLVHGDIWGGNLAVDLETGALNGLFDFADASRADRHLDLMYIHSFGADFTARLFRSYKAASGTEVSWQRTALYHAIAAFAALAETPGEDHLWKQRRHWVGEVCTGPVARMALGA
jgi:aminoglycoside phosphotransferase (APT) family kinase protein